MNTKTDYYLLLKTVLSNCPIFLIHLSWWVLCFRWLFLKDCPILERPFSFPPDHRLTLKDPFLKRANQGMSVEDWVQQKYSEATVCAFELPFRLFFFTFSSKKIHTITIIEKNYGTSCKNFFVTTLTKSNGSADATNRSSAENHRCALIVELLLRIKVECRWRKMLPKDVGMFSFVSKRKLSYTVKFRLTNASVTSTKINISAPLSPNAIVREKIVRQLHFRFNFLTS